MSQNNYWIFCAWLLSISVVCSCSRQQRIEAKGDSPKPITVAVARATFADLSRQLVLTAEFRPYQEVDVHAKVAGYLKKINVDVGDRVSRGQLLGDLEIPEMADDLTRAMAAERRSNAELERARDELTRANAAHEATHSSYARLASVIKARPNLVAQQEIDDALARDRVTEAQIAAAKSAIAAAEQQVQVSRADQDKVKTLNAYSRITAPFAGVVTKRYADTGAMIQAGTASQSQAMPVVRISENDVLRLVLPAPESVVPRIHIGSAVEVRVPTLNRTFQGKVARFSGEVQSSTRTMETEVDVPNPTLVLMPGMYAEALLTLERRRDALAVPVQAIATQDNKATVLLVNGAGVIEARSVTVGLETPSKVEILAGLRQNDLVVIGSRSRLRVGQRVQPKVMEATEGEQ